MSTSAATPDYQAFLRTQLQRQQFQIACYRLGEEQVWLKRAGPGHGMAGYRLLAVLARTLRLEVLRPVPNRGGREVIATEVRRLREFAALGLRAPQVLATVEDGFLMRHLGTPGQDTPSLGNEIHAAVAAGPQAVLQLWQHGLAAIAHAHARGTCLSQAFARNLVRCPDLVVGYVDFEDDPRLALPMPVCQVRDMLCYVHSTASYLRQSGAMDDARQVWRQWLAAPERAPDAVALMQTTVRRLGWLRHLPQDRRWGRDAERLRAAYDLLAPAKVTD